MMRVLLLPLVSMGSVRPVGAPRLFVIGAEPSGE